MAYNTFTMVGKLGIGKESEKFKPFEQKNNGNGWNSKRLRFYAKNSLNFCSMEVSGGYSDKKPVVYGFTKQDGDKKGQPIEVPWNKRNDKEVLEKMAEFKKQVVVIDENTRYESVNGWDFIDHIQNLLKDEQLKDCLYRIQGDVVTNEWEGKFYTKFIPTRIYKVDKEEEQISEGVLELHFGDGCIDDYFEDLQKIFINGYTRQYDNNRKKEIGVPVDPIEISFANVSEEKRQKVYEKYKEIFTVNDERFKKIGLKVNYLSGSQDVEFDESMLDEEQKDLIEMGLITLEEVKKEMGSGKGNFTNSIKVAGLSRGYSRGAEQTDFELKDYLLETEEQDVLDELDDLLDL